MYMKISFILICKSYIFRIYCHLSVDLGWKEGDGGCIGIEVEFVLNSCSKSERNSLTVAASDSFLPSHQ